jgi:hypothetical protein
MTMRERLDQRILGAVQFIDVVSKLPVSLPLRVSGARVQQNRSGLYVIVAPLTGTPAAAAFEDYLETFPAPPTVANTPLTLRVEDFGGQYLAREFTFPAPLQVANENQANYLFKPVAINLFPSPAAPVQMNWAAVRVHVHRTNSTTPIAGALVRVTRNGQNTPVGVGLSDARGEALVAIAGLPLVEAAEDDGPVLTSEYAASVEARVNPAALIPNPDTMAATIGLPSATANVTISPKREVGVDLAITLP